MTDIYGQIETEIPRLQRFARALTRNTGDAEDLVQDCLARALAKQHLWEGGNLRAWLFTILHNQHINALRRARRFSTNIEINPEDPRLSRPGNQDDRLALRDLERVLAGLPDQLRQVIVLIGIEGMKYEKAAKIIGVPVGTIRSRLSRGRQGVRAIIENP